MDNFRRREAVEVSRRGAAVGADVFRVNQVVNLQVRQQIGLRNAIQPVARLAEHRANFLRPALERPQRILAMIEDNPTKRMINAVVNVVTPLAVLLVPVVFD